MATPAVAAAAGRGGILPVEITGQQLLTRVVGVAKRFPSVDGDFVLADRQTVATALNAGVPGSGVTERGLDRPAARASTLRSAAARPPLSALAVASRAGYAHDLDSDPLARGSLLTLARAPRSPRSRSPSSGSSSASSPTCATRAASSLDLEAQGADPATLRRHLRLRALLVGGFGVIGGLATGRGDERARRRPRHADRERDRARAAAPARARLAGCSSPALGGYLRPGRGARRCSPPRLARSTVAERALGRFAGGGPR